MTENDRIKYADYQDPEGYPRKNFQGEEERYFESLGRRGKEGDYMEYGDLDDALYDEQMEKMSKSQQMRILMEDMDFYENQI